MSTEHVDETVEELPEPGESGTASRLEEEGDVAADYLEELLDIADIDGDIDMRFAAAALTFQLFPRRVTTPGSSPS